MTSTALATTSDPILLNTSGGLIKGKLNVALGRLELTPRAIVFYERSRIWNMFGLIGALIATRLKGKRALDIELSSVKELTRTKFGFNKKILDVTLTDGTVHRVMVDKFDDFSSRLREQLAQRGRLESTGEERWAVR